MPFQTNGSVRYFQFDLFEDRVVHAVFSRHGGVSRAAWSSLNLGGTVGDDPEAVAQNREIALTALDRKLDSVYDVWQVHGVDVAIADAPRPKEVPHPQADIILTKTPGVTLMMRFADCVPILLHDPVRKAIGIAHAGWMGTVRGTVRAAVEAMQSRFGSKPANLRAAIGPSIGPDHYQVGPDVVIQVQQTFGPESPSLLSVYAGSMHLDLWAANRILLEKAGVRQIEVAGLCTACHTDDWYSHRAEKGQTGRFGAIIALS
jgi:polyphenol oxidase